MRLPPRWAAACALLATLSVATAAAPPRSADAPVDKSGRQLGIFPAAASPPAPPALPVGTLRRWRQEFYDWLASLSPAQLSSLEEAFAVLGIFLIPISACLCACLVWCYFCWVRSVETAEAYNNSELV